MRSRTSARIRTYQMASSLWIKPVDLRTLGRIANPLQNRCFACIRSSDNEHSELNIWNSGGILLCSHSTKGLLEERLAKVMIRGWFPLGLYVIILCKHQLTASAKPHICFFATFRAFAAFLVKSTKKLSLLLSRVLFELIKK